MKKFVLSLAVLASLSFVACNNAKTEEAAAEEPATEEAVVEEAEVAVDTVAPAVEEVADSVNA